MSEIDSTEVPLEAIRGTEIQEIRGPHGPLDEEGRPLVTVVLANGLEADIRVESVRSERLQDGDEEA